MNGESYEPPSVKTILLIEDNPATALRLGEKLAQQAGYRVIFASDGLTALKFMRSCKPDLMLLDERLLTSNGIDLGPRLSVMQDLQDIPLLLLSTPPQKKDSELRAIFRLFSLSQEENPTAALRR
jgi:CheY-like chemotaxis protein